MTSITLYITGTKQEEKEVKAELETLDVGSESSIEWLAPRKGAFCIRLSSSSTTLLKQAQRKVASRVLDLGGDVTLSLTREKASRRRRW